MAKKDGPHRLRDVLGSVGRRLGLTEPLLTGRLWSHWNAIVGSEIAAHARPSSLRDGVLRIGVDSPAWATELSYMAAEIRDRINADLGSPLVREVRIWARRDGSRGPHPIAREAASEPVPEETPKDSSGDPREAFDRAVEAWSRRSSRRPPKPPVGPA